MTADKASDYEEYKAKLRDLSQRNEGCLAGAELLELTERMGFGFALKEALEHVVTPLVLVVQHDRIFCQAFPLHQVDTSGKKKTS